MKCKNFTLLVLLFLATSCASPYVVPPNVNNISQQLSYEQAVAIVEQRFQMNKTTDGYGLCMGTDTARANWHMSATTKYNFQIDRNKAEFSVDEQGRHTSKVVRTGIGVAVATGRERYSTVKTVIFQDITKIEIKKASWNHTCGWRIDSGFMINLFEGKDKVTIITLREDKLDEFMAAILKLNSNPQLEIFK
jgi:hypothetical protein